MFLFSRGLMQAIPGAVYWDSAGVYNLTSCIDAAYLAGLPVISIFLGDLQYALQPTDYAIQVRRYCADCLQTSPGCFHVHFEFMLCLRIRPPKVHDMSPNPVA